MIQKKFAVRCLVLEELLELPGVARKTANIVLGMRMALSRIGRYPCGRLAGY